MSVALHTCHDVSSVASLVGLVLSIGLDLMGSTGSSQQFPTQDCAPQRRTPRILNSSNTAVGHSLVRHVPLATCVCFPAVRCVSNVNVFLFLPSMNFVNFCQLDFSSILSPLTANKNLQTNGQRPTAHTSLPPSYTVLHCKSKQSQPHFVNTQRTHSSNATPSPFPLSPFLSFFER